MQHLLSKSIPHILTLALLGLAIYLFAPQFASLKESFNVVRQLSPGFVILALAAQVASYYGSGYLMQASVSTVKERITIFQGALVTLAANSVSLLAGGSVTAFALTFRWMHRLGVNAQGASLAGTLPYVFNNLVLLVLSLFGLVYLLINHELSRLQALFFAAVMCLFLSIFVAVVWALRNQAQLTHIVNNLGRRWATFRHHSYNSEKTESAIKQLFDARRHLRNRGWIKPLAGAALNIGFDMLNLYILFGAFGHSVGLGVLLVGYGLPLLFGKVGFLPGGLGIVEGTMTVLYGGLGLSSAVVIVVILARAGVFEIGLDGSLRRLSVDPVSAIARNAEGSVIGVAGTTIERWDGNRFVPLLFQVDHPRWAHNTFYLSSPVDLAIDEQGDWFLLFSGGVLVLLDSQGSPLGLMDNEDAIPASARKLLVNPTTGELFVGGNEGLVVISPADFP